jgi:hypothetical protein
MRRLKLDAAVRLATGRAAFEYRVQKSIWREFRNQSGMLFVDSGMHRTWLQYVHRPISTPSPHRMHGLQARLPAIEFSLRSCYKNYYFVLVTEVEKRRSPHERWCTVMHLLSSIFAKIPCIISSSDLHIFFSCNMKYYILLNQM